MMSFPVETAVAEEALPKKRRPRVARVLLADTALASRLALKTILSTAGYAVSGAATAAEARGALFARTRYIDRDGTALEFLVVELVDCLLSFIRGSILNEGETA